MVDTSLFTKKSQIQEELLAVGSRMEDIIGDFLSPSKIRPWHLSFEAELWKDSDLTEEDLKKCSELKSKALVLEHDLMAVSVEIEKEESEWT